MRYELINLINYRQDKLIAAFATIPKDVTILIASDNSLGSRSGVQLAQAFEVIPNSVTALFLSDNSLDRRSGRELAEAFAAIPKGISTLGLGSNRLYKKSAAELTEAFSAISKSVTTLDLMFNNLGDRRQDELAQIFAAIPTGVTTLGLDYSALWLKSEAELTAVFTALPKGITTLYLAENDLGNSGAYFAKILPFSVQSVCLRGETIDLIPFHKARMIENLQSQLNIIESKAKDLQSRKFSKAHDATITLYDTLTQLKNKYSSGAIEYPAFKKDSMEAIKIAHKELDQHRGWKEILGNIAYCILGLGFLYAAYCAYKGKFFDFKTDSAQKLDDLQHSIDPETPNP